MILSEETEIKTKKAFVELIGKRLATDVAQELIEEVVDEETGEVKEAKRRMVILARDHEIAEEDYDILKEAGVDKVLTLKISSEDAERSVILNHYCAKTATYNERNGACRSIPSKSEPAKCLTQKPARQVLERLFLSVTKNMTLVK